MLIFAIACTLVFQLLRNIQLQQTAAESEALASSNIKQQSSK